MSSSSSPGKIATLELCGESLPLLTWVCIGGGGGGGGGGEAEAGGPWWSAALECRLQADCLPEHV